MLHNLILGSFSLINSGVDSIVNGQREPRYTPYHIRHRTEVAGFMTILHGDDRIYNNIFVQQHKIDDKKKTAADADYKAVGTAPFDIFPTYEEWADQFDLEKDPDMGHLAEAHFGHLPVWVDGNAYFNGATVYKKEKNKLVDKKTKVAVELKEKNGDYYIKTNYDKLLKDFACGVLSTESLGVAFEPEQKYENPDGTPITFDRDILGNHRSSETIPGPLSTVSSKELLVWKHLVL